MPNDQCLFRECSILEFVCLFRHYQNNKKNINNVMDKGYQINNNKVI